MVELHWQEKLCYNLRVSLQLVAFHLCNHGLYKCVYWKAWKTYCSIYFEIFLIYKIAIQLLILHLQRVQIF